MRKSLLLVMTVLLCFCLSSCDKILNMAKSAVTGEEISKPPEDFIATIEGEEYTYELYEEYVKIIEYVGEATEIEIPSEIDDRPVKVIGTLCFNKKQVVSVTIPYSVKIIENSAFYYADALTSIVIPDTVEVIETRAFGWCNALESVVVGTGVEAIPDFCFNHCVSLASVEIPNNIKSIGVRAFSYCDKLTEITIPETITSVGDLAFEYCSALKFVTFKNGETQLGSNVFSNSPETAIVAAIDSGVYNYCFENQLLWTDNIDTEPIKLNPEQETEQE